MSARDGLPMGRRKWKPVLVKGDPPDCPLLTLLNVLPSPSLRLRSGQALRLRSGQENDPAPRALVFHFSAEGGDLVEMSLETVVEEVLLLQKEGILPPFPAAPKQTGFPELVTRWLLQDATRRTSLWQRVLLDDGAGKPRFQIEAATLVQCLQQAAARYLPMGWAAASDGRNGGKP